MIESHHSSASGIEPPTIRQASHTDAEQIISGIHRICAEENVFYTKRFVPTPQWETVLYRPETSSDHKLLVAERNGKILGAGRLFSDGEDTLIHHVAELGIFVLKPYRRQGIGSQIMLGLMNWAARVGLEKITLTVFSTNQPGILFFEKNGFVQEGRMPRQIKKGKHYIDLLIMGYFLSGIEKHR